MKTHTIYKISSIKILILKSIVCLIVLATSTTKYTVTAQTTEQDSLKYWNLDISGDHFWDPHCPTPSAIFDGYNLWMLRQKMVVRAYQTLLNNEVNLDNGNISKVQFTNYMPLVDAGNFNSIIGTQYSKFDIQSDNEFNLNKSIQMVWLWTAWQYKYKRWNFTFTTENSFRGDENALYEKTGNRNLILVYIGYEFNRAWDLILLGRFAEQEMCGETQYMPIGGIQARYQPSGKFKMLFGIPTLFAAEWTALSHTDIGMKFMYTTESHFFIRQRISKYFSISAQYYSTMNNSDATYFNNKTFSPDNISQVIFNNISYLQHQVFASLDLKLYKDIGFSIGAGYNLSSGMSLYNNEDKVFSRINGEDNYFVNFSLQFGRLK